MAWKKCIICAFVPSNSRSGRSSISRSPLANPQTPDDEVAENRMHSYFYYPSTYGPVHPGLKRDLLGEQVVACRKRNIKVYAYYCVTWANYLAEHHPEWLMWKRDRTTYLLRFDETPGWTALCLSNEDFVQLVPDHSREIITSYDIDGIWYDMPYPREGECFCSNCLATLRARGRDPFAVA